VAVILEILHQFDPAIWQTKSQTSTGTSVLITWTVAPPPIDAGIPLCVARVFAEALCSFGAVIYAGDDKDENFRCAVDVVVRRGLRRLRLVLFCANSPAQLLPAFTSARHDWSMNAQWLVVTDSTTKENGVIAVVKTLYEDWILPDQWPPGVIMIVQAAVDGDGAACFSANKSVEERFLQALGGSARAAGMELQIDS
jgi:hypothetical protein